LFRLLGFVARSTVFHAMLNAPMLEAAQNTIEIPDFEEDVVKAMLDYIYTGDTEDLVSGFNMYTCVWFGLRWVILGGRMMLINFDL